MLRWLPLLLLLVQPAKPDAQSAADALCGQLRTMSDAANREGSFERLASSGFRPDLLRHCRPSGSNAFVCSQNLAPASVAPATLGPRLAQCLPNGRLEQPLPWPRSGTTFRDGRLSITMTSHCDERCKAGRIASVIFEVEPAAAQGD